MSFHAGLQNGKISAPHIGKLWHAEVSLWPRLHEMHQIGMAGCSLPDTLVFNKLLTAACLLSTKRQAGLAVLAPLLGTRSLCTHWRKTPSSQCPGNQQMCACACTHAHVQKEQDRSGPGIPKYSTDWAAALFPSGLKENIILLPCLPPSANTAVTNAYLSFYVSEQAPCVVLH